MQTATNSEPNMQTDNKPRVRYSVESLVKRLKQARIEKGMSQRALSAQTGVAAARISKIERGYGNLSLETLIDLARALDFEPMLVQRKYIPAVEALIKRGPGALKEPMYLPDWGEDDD